MSHISTSMRARRGALRSTACIAATIAVGAGLAPAAHATGYRYWSYWDGTSGTWTASQTGPADHRVKDGAVEGWRFGISETSPTAGPDNSPDFASLCPSLATTTAPTGSVRVAVVIDAGFTADAPRGEQPFADRIACVTVPDGSNGSQVLAKAAKVREQGGMVCAVDGYPTDECAAAVDDAAVTAAAAAAAKESPNPAVPAADGSAAAESSAGSGAAGWLAWAVLLPVGAAAAVVVARRRRGTTGV